MRTLSGPSGWLAVRTQISGRGSLQWTRCGAGRHLWASDQLRTLLPKSLFMPPLSCRACCCHACQSN